MPGARKLTWLSDARGEETARASSRPGGSAGRSESAAKAVPVNTPRAAPAGRWAAWQPGAHAHPPRRAGSGRGVRAGGPRKAPTLSLADPNAAAGQGEGHRKKLGDRTRWLPVRGATCVSAGAAQHSAGTGNSGETA